MGYRGDDLDLRTPQAASDAPYPGDAPPPSPRIRTSRGGPIWVDDTVLACCNHAFDVASAHRAAEVRLEHLIYALTRIDEAAQAFEDRGVRVIALRREVATVIATDIPVASSNGKTTPRRAEGFEQVLRQAAAQAYRRQDPVNVADIVNILIDGAAAEWTNLGRLISVVPRAPAEPIYEPEPPAPRERIRAAAPPPAPRTASAIELATLQAAAGAQHSRIDAIEQSIRALTTELASERKIITGVLQDLQRELMAQREETSRIGGISPDKIQAVFGDRLQSLEQAFLSSRNTGNGELQERLGMLERAISSEITLTRAAVDALGAKPATDLTALTLRLEAIQEAIAGERERAKTRDEAVAAALDRLDTTDAERAAQHVETHQRLGALGDALAAHVTRTDEANGVVAQDLTAIRETLNQLGEQIAQETARLNEQIGQEATRLSDAIAQESAKLTEALSLELSEVHVGISKLSTNQHALAGAFDTQAQDAANAFVTLAARIESLEKAAARPVEMLEALSGTVDKMHRVTVERYYRRNRFWYWLFGTDDWLAASWPSQSARIAEELRAIKH